MPGAGRGEEGSEVEKRNDPREALAQALIICGVVARRSSGKVKAAPPARCRHDYRDGDVCSKCDAVRP